jgi:hypothetical protein
MATVVAPAVAPARTAARAAAVPWHIYAVLFASTSIVVGVIWDISWHMTIGRDTFWTPAHLAMYLGGVVGGVANGIVVLRTTFAGTPEEKASAVRFWGFRGPLGSWVTIWGSFAMLTSAPFDNWWHDAYGLDVEILSPPHTILALGMVATAFGALLCVAALQNRAETDADTQRYGWLYAYGAGIVLSFHAIMITEYTERVLMHTSIFYRVACGVLPLSLIALARGSRLKWAATSVALVYTAIRLVMLWVLPLFPATPKLGPIYQDITHMVPMQFPLLVIVPAIAIDLIAQRNAHRNDWLMSVVYGLVFFALFLAAQWLFADFLMSRWSMNPIFATDEYFYGLPKTSSEYRRVFFRWPSDRVPGGMVTGLMTAAVLAVLSTRLGLWYGTWLRRVRR